MKVAEKERTKVIVWKIVIVIKLWVRPRIFFAFLNLQTTIN